MAKSSNVKVTNGEATPLQRCPVTAMIELIGGRWKPIILYYLTIGPKRFGEIHVRVEGISRKVLTEQLKELESNGLITRTAYKEIPPRVEYRLTELGKSLDIVFNAIVHWAGDTILAGQANPYKGR